MKRLNILLLNPDDNVAVLLENGTKGDSIFVHDQEIVLQEDIDFAHKILIKDGVEKSPILKYGTEIGYLLEAVPKGSWIHGHNMACDRGKTRRDKL